VSCPDLPKVALAGLPQPKTSEARAKHLPPRGHPAGQHTADVRPKRASL